MTIAMNLAANPLMQYAIDPLRELLLSFGTLGMLVWVVLKILAIAVPVIETIEVQAQNEIQEALGREEKTTGEKRQ